MSIVMEVESFSLRTQSTRTLVLWYILVIPVRFRGNENGHFLQYLEYIELVFGENRDEAFKQWHVMQDVFRRQGLYGTN